MQMKSSKNIVLGIVLSLILLVSIISFSYALFVYTRTSSNKIELTSGSITFGYSEGSNGIVMSNAFPIADSDALNSTDANNYFDFDVLYDISDGAYVNYEIDIVNSTLELDAVKGGTLTSLPSASVKVALVNLDDDEMVVGATYFSQLESVRASNQKDGYYLYSKDVYGNSVDNYRLYMWIPEVDATEVDVNPFAFGDNSIKDKVFSVKINVQAIAEVEE